MSAKGLKRRWELAADLTASEEIAEASGNEISVGACTDRMQQQQPQQQNKDGAAIGGNVAAPSLFSQGNG